MQFCQNLKFEAMKNKTSALNQKFIMHDDL